ncbi:c-type cytochrome biogenesis protein CcmI [Rhizobacter sp. AJA081-3]|nr:c-type cytochrome biogenesis protein CcmI [Rhizobacter sp. AJA081-3]QTN23323.1 c-type cytochrome biogenesis protein CcmI [Rhizobacter sp. AJA081-3]
MNADIARLRQQLRQLQSLHEEGALGAAAYERSRGELERKLLDAVMRDGHDAGPESGRPAGPSRALLAGIGAAMLVIAGTGYWWTRTPAPAADMPIASARQAGTPAAPASAPHALSFQQIEDMAGRLAQRLKADPKDAEGWAMLARSYTMLGRRAEAVTAYERAVALQGQDASLLADYADALAVTRESRLAGEPAALVERALKLDPNHGKALSLAGTAAFERKDYAAAVARWEHLLKVAPPDSPFVEPMRANIAQARELGGLAGAGQAASGPRIGIAQPLGQ